MNLRDLIEEAGYETRSYSGRCMYGATCLGVELEDRLGDFFASLLDAIANLQEEDRDEALDLAHEFRSMKTDSMGRGMIVYFESVPYVADADVEDDDEETDTRAKCDGCGEPIAHGEHFTDEAVCGNGDGPGFLLCGSDPCNSSHQHLPVEARRVYFAAQREKNEASR